MTTLYQQSTMKKLLLLLLLFTGVVKAQIVNIPDPIFKAKLVTANPTDVDNKIAKNFNDEWMTIDANGDGEIQVSEAQAVKMLNVSHSAITDITGLTSFSNLQSLSLILREITSLDLNTLTSLKSLSCFNMPYLTSLSINNLTNLIDLNVISLYNLTSLNVSSLTSLTKLNCIYGGLTTLNVNGLTNLTELNCAGNQLTNLNGLPNITKLNCSQNLLTSLNLTGLTNLAELDCSSNQLTNLNGLPNLTQLNCSYNQLTALNVTGLTNLNKLLCMGNNFTGFILNGLPNLITLDCSGNNNLETVNLTNLAALQDFKVIGTVDMSANPIGHLTSLTLSGLPNLKKLDCSNSVLTSLDLNGLTSLTEVICSRNQITSLNVSNLPNLQKLICDTNPISNLDVSNMPNLIELSCAGGYAVDSQIVGHLNTLNVSGSTNLKRLYCAYSLMTTLNVDGLINLEELYCDGLGNNSGHLTTLNVNSLTSLKRLSCTSQQLTSLNVSNLVNLTDLYCSYNHITNLDLTGLVNLKTLDYNYNQLANLNLVNLPSLTALNCANNQLTTLNVLNLTNLKELNCSVNQLTTLNLSGLSSLESLTFSYNQIALSNISGLSTNLKSLYCDYNALTSIDVSNLPNLETLSCANNELTSIDVSSLNHLKFLDISTNQLSTIDVSNLTVLEYLDVYQNQLTALNLNGLTTLRQLSYSENMIPNLDVSFLTNLEMLQCDNTQSTEINVNTLTKLTNLSCTNNQIATLDVSALSSLTFLQCQNNLITTLDLNNSIHLLSLNCDNNQLSTLFVKNGKVEQGISFSNNPTLQYICADAMQLPSIQTQLNDLGMNTTVSNSYCSFTPGGNHNTINGIAIFDADNNGCDVTDVVNPFVRLNINDGTESGATVTNINGSYNFYTNAGTYAVTPNVENPAWFNFSPTSATFEFLNDNNNISTQNFCIAAVGTHQDIEVVLAQIGPARPGFDAIYKIVYKNKGNQMVSGAVNVIFDDARTDFVYSTPNVDAMITNSLTWNYTNLMPFESRSILFTLNINSPVETPAVNNGDILNFTASITPVIGDELPDDNTFIYNQTVVGSFDPNDITCLEGNTVSPTEIGKYLHYVISFENTGTFYAENVVVKDSIDTSKYDINSLQVLNTSHTSYTRITGNVVEFVFQNINLAATSGNPPVGGHGDVLFKIRTKDDLVANDIVTKQANIYFDYNAPINTLPAETVFALLSNTGFELDSSISIYPNPTASKINISAKTGIKSIALYDIQGRILQTVIGDLKVFDIADKANGVYFLKIITDQGSKVEKVVKK